MKIYRFRKKDRDEQWDFETAYAFRRQGPGKYGNGGRWFNLNKKATTIIERDDHLEIQIQDWYIQSNWNGKHNEHAIKRQIDCEYCEAEYLNTINDEKENKSNTGESTQSDN